MGSGSDNYFRLDLPASVAKPVGDELLVFREERHEGGEKIRDKNEKSALPGIIHHLQKPVRKKQDEKTFSVVHFSTIWLYSLILIWCMRLRNFAVVSKILSNLYLQRAVSNCKEKEWLNNEVELFGFSAGDKALKFTMFNAFTT